VLVVATPCSLILAVPVAVVSGVSRCASFGLLVKGGAVLEALARIQIVVSDKTGTVTQGAAMLVSVDASGALAEDEVLRLAASLDQASTHVVAEAIIAAAHHRNSQLSPPSRVRESPGRGIAGQVDGVWVVVGGPSFVAEQIGAVGGRTGAGAVAPGTIQWWSRSMANWWEPWCSPISCDRKRGRHWTGCAGLAFAASSSPRAIAIRWRGPSAASWASMPLLAGSRRKRRSTWCTPSGGRAPC
jgi:hypothetical protein